MIESEQVSAGQPAQVDAATMSLAIERLRSDQNLPLGIAAGAMGALIGGGLWAAITVLTQFQIGWMAVGVGVLVGIGIRTMGKGVDRSFGLAGATLALAGCLLGNLLAACGILARQEGIAFFEVLSRVDIPVAGALMSATFSPMDLLFYGIAVYEGYKLSIRQVTPADLTERAAG